MQLICDKTRGILLALSKIRIMKPIYKWIEELPQPKRSEAENNMLKYPLSDRYEICDSFNQALLRAFVWGMGTGTLEYWSNIYLDKQKTLF